jgi:hypothetical protein
LRWTPGLGHICHVKSRDADRWASRADNVRTVGSRKTTKSLQLPEWSTLGAQIDQLRLRIRAEEQQVFLALRDEVSRTNLPSPSRSPEMGKIKKKRKVLEDL